MDELDELFDEIDRGREGRNQGFTMGLPKLENLVGGVLPSVYTLIFAATGAGKSSFALYSYVYRPLMEHLDDDKFRITYFSLEMKKKVLYARLLCLYLFDTYGVEISQKEIFSKRRNYRLNDEYYQLIKDSRPWLEKVKKHMIVYDKTCTAKYLLNKLLIELKSTGDLKLSGSGDELEITYKPKDPDLVHVVVVDHIGLLSVPNMRLKSEIDALSSTLVQLRNACGISPVVISQINRDAGNIERRKQGLNNLTINDVKDSGNPSQDCEVAISVFDPFREKLASYNKYDVKTLEDNFRVVTVQKSRDGEACKEIGVNFFGRMGYWKEMPKPDEIYDWQKYTNPSYILNPETEESKINETNNVKLNLVI